MSKNIIKLSVGEIVAIAKQLEDYAIDLQQKLNECKNRIKALDDNQEFKSIAGSIQFYQKLEDFSAKCPAFIIAINNFATFLNDYVVSDFELADNSIVSIQSELEANLANLNGEIGA